MLGFWPALVLGIGAGIHCTFMCGPLMLAMQRKNLKSKLTYQSGRITTYLSLGVLFGIIGRTLWLAGLQNHLAIGAGLLIIVMVLLPERLYLQSAPLKRLMQFKTSLQLRIKDQGLLNSFSLGILNGLVPCPMVYVALAGALGMANVPDAALFMLIFGAGTLLWLVPVIFSSGWIEKILPLRAMQKISPMVAVLLAVWLILRGANVDIPYVAHKIQFPNGPSTTIENCD